MVSPQFQFLIWHFICLWEEADVFVCTHKPEKGCAALGSSDIFKVILALFKFRTNTTTFFKGKNSSLWQKKRKKENHWYQPTQPFFSLCVCADEFSFWFDKNIQFFPYSTSHSIQKIPYYTAGIIYSWHFPSLFFLSFFPLHFCLLLKETTQTNRIESITGIKKKTKKKKTELWMLIVVEIC